jgi:putative ABC transport system substrate-binding protein
MGQPSYAAVFARVLTAAHTRSSAEALSNKCSGLVDEHNKPVPSMANLMEQTRDQVASAVSGSRLSRRKSIYFFLLKGDIVSLLHWNDPAREGRMAIHIGRRELIITLSGAVAAWPFAVRAQQGDRFRRIGVLMPGDENDPEGKRRLSAFAQALADSGWTDGRNVRMDVRWAGGDVNRIRALAQQLVALQPDVIVTGGTAAPLAVQRETRTIPIVFTVMAEPVASGLVARLDRPGGNVTGFANFEPSLGSKWLELLSEIAPGLKRVAIMFNPDTAPASAYMPSLETAARSLKVEAIPAPIHDDVEIETAIIALGREPGGGLVVLPDIFTFVHRAPIILAAARNNVPAVCADSVLARDGGLLSYGVDFVDIYRRAPSYVDRILRGANPAELPVQFPTKFTMVLNLKTAKALGLAVPSSILVRADEVIE